MVEFRLELFEGVALLFLFQLLNNSEPFNQPSRKIPQGFLYSCFVSLLLVPVTLHKLPGNCEVWVRRARQAKFLEFSLKHKSEAG